MNTGDVVVAALLCLFLFDSNIIVFIFLWILEPIADVLISIICMTFGDFGGWSFLVAPRLRRMKERFQRLYASLPRFRSKSRVECPVEESPPPWAITNPSKWERLCYIIMLMSYDEVITYEDATTPYRIGKPIVKIVHHASPLERIFGVGLWPFT